MQCGTRTVTNVCTCNHQQLTQLMSLQACNTEQLPSTCIIILELLYSPGERRRLSRGVYWQACRTQFLAWPSFRHLQGCTTSRCGLAGEGGALSARGGWCPQRLFPSHQNPLAPITILPAALLRTWHGSRAHLPILW